MESIQSNQPVVARAVEFNQEAKRLRELAQEAAAKIENPLREQPSIRVTFSQEAQTRLNEEKTHALNRVIEVRNAARTAAAEERSKAISEQRQKDAADRVEARDLRVERDHVARDKAIVADKALADNRELVEKVAKATHSIREAATARAIEQQALKAEALVERRNADDFNRAFVAKTRETSDLLEKQKRTVVVKNIQESAKNNEVAIAHSKKVKSINDRVKVETAKAMKMYKHIDAMG